MISVSAAALLAQVYPVFLLLLALEARALRTKPSDAQFFRVYMFVIAVISAFAVVGGVTAVAFCLDAVIREKVLDGVPAIVTIASGFGMQLGVAALLPLLFLKRAFFSEPE